MKAKRLLVVILSVFLLVPCAFAQRVGQDFNSLSRFQDALRQDGFDVTPGAVVDWNLAAEWCANTPGVDTALYFNIEPYLQVQVPASAREPDQLSAQFKLDPREAVVLMGLTPPPEKYFSFTPYLWSRVYPDGSRRDVMATLGDSVNVATVKSVGPTPFNAPVALIFTPDQTTESRVRAALRRSGYPASIIHTVVFPASMLKLGHGETADLLTIAIRNAIWTDSTAGSDYVNNPPLKVFRVTPRTAADADSFPSPPLRIRGTGHTEMDLANKLGELRQGIIAANPGLQASDITLIPMCYEGYDLIQRGLELCGDSRDAFYLGAGIPEYDPINQIRLADGEFLMVYGPNHVATGKATYMNINVYASETAKLTLGAINDQDFTDKGTAAPFLTLDSSTLLGVFTRMYLEPATKIGPAMPEILYDRVLKFSPQP
jgi:hypothetical protein